MRTEGFNPLCGDEVIVFVDVDDNNVITDIAIGGQGCSISQASASMMSAAIKGTSIGEARQFISAFKGLMSIHEGELGGDGSEAEMGIDADVADAADIRLGDLEALKGVVKFPVRIKCATLSWNTLAQALDEAAKFLQQFSKKGAFSKLCSGTLDARRFGLLDKRLCELSTELGSALDLQQLALQAQRFEKIEGLFRNTLIKRNDEMRAYDEEKYLRENPPPPEEDEEQEGEEEEEDD